MKRIILVFSCIVLLLVVAGCTQPLQDSGQPTPIVTATETTHPPTPTQYTTTIFSTPRETTPTVSDNTIVIQDLAFNPDTITVKVGATVRWVNRDSVPHSVNFAKASGINPSGPLSASQSFSVTFDDKGTYPYACSIHPSMQGTVIVV